jgi:hypothetical protein
MAIKGFGVAVKLTFGGNNQFTHLSTYAFMIVVAGCIVVQMNYFNKALDTFSTNVYVLSLFKTEHAHVDIWLCRVNPLYYVGFSSCTILASLILFQGFNTTGGTNTISLLAGFAVTFIGVHVLNISRKPEPAPRENGHSALESGLMNPRLSLQGRMSLDGWNGVSDTRGEGVMNSSGHGRSSSLYRAQSTTLFNAFEEDGPDAVALDDLHEEEEDDDADERTRLHRSHPPPSRNRNGSPLALQDSAPRPVL